MVVRSRRLPRRASRPVWARAPQRRRRSSVRMSRMSTVSRSSSRVSTTCSRRSFLPQTYAARARTPWRLPSCSSTARTASRSVRAPTSTRCSLTSTTAAPRPRASTYTRSPCAPRSTSLLARATSRALTRPRSSSRSRSTRLSALARRRYAYTRSTTTCCASCPAWVASRTATKQTA